MSEADQIVPGALQDEPSSPAESVPVTLTNNQIRSPAARQSIAGWGNFPRETCQVYRPEQLQDLREIVTAAPERDLIPRGLGRSYGDASLNRDRGVVLSHHLDRMLDFDPETGVLCCEASVSLAEVIEHFLHRGFFFPVTPGTKFISIGGAIAADVHGKNHHFNGSMSEFVLDFHILVASGEVLLCSREVHSELFWATIGGMGLTGMILDARIQLHRVETSYMTVQHERANHLDACMSRFLESDAEFAYAVAWIDCLSKGASLGRSVLMRANHARVADLPAKQRRDPFGVRFKMPFNVPFTFPAIALNSATMGIFNSVFYHTHRSRKMIVDCDSYFYPLDRIHHWNRIYGRPGVLQYQLALPPQHSHDALVEILETLSYARRGSFLAVLKTFGPGSEGLLSFPMQGHTLALDLPNTGPDLVRELHAIDEVVLRHGGRIYLAKDACTQADLFEQMYPELRRFREIKQRYDPANRFNSSLARRLAIVEGE